MALTESHPLSLITALQKPTGDVTETTSIFYTVFGLSAENIQLCSNSNISLVKSAKVFSNEPSRPALVIMCAAFHDLKRAAAQKQSPER